MLVLAAIGLVAVGMLTTTIIAVVQGKDIATAGAGFGTMLVAVVLFFIKNQV